MKKTDLCMEVALKISMILKKKGLTQRELANRLGKSEPEISKWLRGKHNLTLHTIENIGNVLGEPIITTHTEIAAYSYNEINLPIAADEIQGYEANPHS